MNSFLMISLSLSENPKWVLVLSVMFFMSLWDLKEVTFLLARSSSSALWKTTLGFTLISLKKALSFLMEPYGVIYELPRAHRY